MGWNGDKDNQSRKYLSDLKDMATYWSDLPYQDVLKRTQQFNDMLTEYGVEQKGFVFIHCREPNEISRIKSNFPFQVLTVLIRREGYNSYGNHADDEVENYNYDFTFNNEGTIGDLEETAFKFYQDVKMSRS